MSSVSGYVHENLDPKKIEILIVRLSRYEALFKATGVTLEEAEEKLQEHLDSQIEEPAIAYKRKR